MKKLLLILLISIGSVWAAINPVEFDTETQQLRYDDLIAELRCLVCQNQNLADSNAELAVDLKRIVREQILQGASDQQILDFMTERYGDFVLYRPPVNSVTLLLWWGPALFLLIGLITVFVYVRRSKVRQPTLDRSQRQKVKALLKDKDQ